jgi:hypothetical protein
MYVTIDETHFGRVNVRSGGKGDEMVCVDLWDGKYCAMLCMTSEQAGSLAAKLEQHLQDRSVAAAEQTTCTGDEVLAVIGDDTVTVEQLRAMMPKSGPVGESEMLARHAQGTTPCDAELRRRSGIEPKQCGYCKDGDFCIRPDGHDGDHYLYPF